MGAVFRAHTKYPTLRRCGVGVAKIDEVTGALIYGCYFQLPGHVQTVYRAEALALQTVVGHVNSGEEVTSITDNKFVHDTFYKESDIACKGVNGDIFTLIFEDIRDRAIRVNVLWMPSHTAVEESEQRQQDQQTTKKI